MDPSFPSLRLSAESHTVVGRFRLRAVLAIALCWGVSAASLADTAGQAAPTVKSSGQYALLDNDQVLKGTIFRRGTSVIVRRGNEAELTLRSNQVIAVENSLPQLFQARIQAQHRRSAPTLSQRISDARWCIDNALPAHATEALMKVYAVAPNHPSAIQLERRLRSLLEESASPSTSVKHIATAQFNDDSDSSDSIQVAGHAESIESTDARVFESETSVHSSVAPASVYEFTAKVQPILMARCAECHHEKSGAATSWNLALPPAGSTRMTQPGTLANLDATLPFCDSSDPEQSKLVQKAITAHGSMSPTRPSITRHETALATALTRWIATLRTQGQPPVQSDSMRETVEPASFDTSEEANFPPLNPINPADVASHLSSPQPGSPAPDSSTPQSADPVTIEQQRPTRLPRIDNPNDVEQFNRQTRLRRRLGLR